MIQLNFSSDHSQRSNNRHCRVIIHTYIEWFILKITWKEYKDVCYSVTLSNLTSHIILNGGSYCPNTNTSYFRYFYIIIKGEINIFMINSRVNKCLWLNRFYRSMKYIKHRLRSEIYFLEELRSEIVAWNWPIRTKRASILCPDWPMKSLSRGSYFQVEWRLTN